MTLLRLRRSIREISSSLTKRRDSNLVIGSNNNYHELHSNQGGLFNKTRYGYNTPTFRHQPLSTRCLTPASSAARHNDTESLQRISLLPTISHSSFVRRSFATTSNKKKNKKKGAMIAQQQQQQQTPTANKAKEEKPKRPTPFEVAQPVPLIRTDFSQSKLGSLADLNLPSGYQLDNHNTTTNTTAYVDYKELYNPEIHLPSAPQNWDDYEPATPLWEEVAAQIGVTGRPLTVAEFMQLALMHPQHGYYAAPTRDIAEEVDSDEDLFSDSDDEEDNDTVTSNNNKKNPIFGPRGDFVTAPEICQVFGESLVVWLVTQFELLNKPDAIQMVELGPGNGTLVADMVQFALQSPNNRGSLTDYGRAVKVIHLIEQSPALRRKQQETLQNQVGHLVQWTFHNNNNNSNKEQETSFEESTKDVSAVTDANNKPDIHVYWHDSFAALSTMILKGKQPHFDNGDASPDLSSMPLMVVCQEFFDALPVHAFEFTADGWRERMVDMAIRDELLEEEDENNDEATKNSEASADYKSAPSKDTVNLDSKHKRPRLRIVLAPEVTPALKTLLHVDEEGKLMTSEGSGGPALQTEIGQVVEVCPEGILLVQDIAALLQQQGGAALIVDYGEEGSSDTLRGFWKHKQTHFLSLPGQTDVTADVDFTALKHAVNHGRPTRANDSDNETTTNPSSTTSQPTVKAYGPIPQGKFLVSMGAQERVIQAIENDSTTDEQAEDLYRALERLVAPEQMGVRYKVLALAHERKDKGDSFTVPPPGFGDR